MKCLSFRGRFALAAALALLSVSHGGAATAWAAEPPDRRHAAIADAIGEASQRFGVPVDWIWLVLRAESGGDVAAVSSAGAIGLMQIMPATYHDLRRRHGLGPDPFAVRDNILAGTAYLRELHDRYGAIGMLAAYNAGPGRWEHHLATGRALPGETQRYLARLSPAIAPGTTVVSATPVSAPPISPFAAPIFVARTTVRRSIVDPSPRARTATDASRADAAPAPVRALAALAPYPADASDGVVPLRSGRLFVTSSSRDLRQ